MPIKLTSIDIDGIYVERATPDQILHSTPLLFVHGGTQGSWAWAKYLPYFAEAGWDCYALNWYNHYKSASLPQGQFLKRSIADVTEEVAKVVAHIGSVPALIGHSMGGMVCQQYAQKASVKALVLVASIMPKEIEAPNISLPAPVDDNQPFGPPPFEFAKQMFFQNMSDQQAEEEFKLLCPESPRAVREATEHLLSISNEKITCPALALGAELDHLAPNSSVQKLADYLGADYLSFSSMGHNLITANGWENVASSIQDWLGSNVASGI